MYHREDGTFEGCTAHAYATDITAYRRKLRDLYPAKQVVLATEMLPKLTDQRSQTTRRHFKNEREVQSQLVECRWSITQAKAASLGKG